MAKCRACAADIRFTETKNGKLMPVNADGTSHFSNCPEATRFRKRATPDNICAGCGSDNVERLPGTGPHFGALRCHACSAHRWLRKPQETQT